MPLMVSTTFGSLPNVSRVHSSTICCALRSGIPRQPAEAVQIRLREMVAEPVLVQAHVGDADEAAVQPRSLAAPGVHRRASPHAQVEIERLFPHRHQEHGVPRLAEVLLRDLQLDRLLGLLQRAEQRRRRLAHLEIDGPVLDLDDDVVVELAVERLEVVVGGAGAIVLQIASSPCGGRRRSRDRRSARRAASSARATTLAASACVRP